jgi:protein phosphatase 1 regulatory subunit 7
MNNEPIYDVSLVKWYRLRIADLTLDNVEVIKKALGDNEIDGVSVSHYHGFVGNNIELLRELPNLRGLMLHEREPFDCSVLETLDQLELFQAGTRSKPLNFASFPKMVNLRIGWHPKDQFPAEMPNLEALYIAGYKSKSKNLIEMPKANKLARLEFVRGNLETLTGIERYRQLRDIDLAYCAKLQSIAALQGTDVERIHLESCKKIDDMTSLAGCPKLKSIRMSKGAALESLAFLNESRTLEEFRFVTTDVIDGDLTPLLRMKHVGFLPKRNFSHTPGQIKALIGDTSP